MLFVPYYSDSDIPGCIHSAVVYYPLPDQGEAVIDMVRSMRGFLVSIFTEDEVNDLQCLSDMTWRDSLNPEIETTPELGPARDYLL